MARAVDVAAHITKKCGSMSAMKLQKLAYYAKAWHLVWSEESLFPDEIQAWANGPVVCTLYQMHRGLFEVNERTFGDGDPAALSEDQVDSVGVVLDFYCRFSAHELSEITHREAPWRDAREGLSPGERGTSPITDAALAEFYSSLAS